MLHCGYVTVTQQSQGVIVKLFRQQQGGWNTSGKHGDTGDCVITGGNQGGQ